MRQTTHINTKEEKMKQVVITLSKTGGRKVEVKGFVGSGCQDATAFLETAFGKATDTKLKDSYFQDETETNYDTDGLPGGGNLCG
jgi:hypothetical protein